MQRAGAIDRARVRGREGKRERGREGEGETERARTRNVRGSALLSTAPRGCRSAGAARARRFTRWPCRVAVMPPGQTGPGMRAGQTLGRRPTDGDRDGRCITSGGQRQGGGAVPRRTPGAPPQWVGARTRLLALLPLQPHSHRAPLPRRRKAPAHGGDGSHIHQRCPGRATRHQGGAQRPRVPARCACFTRTAPSRAACRPVMPVVGCGYGCAQSFARLGGRGEARLPACARPRARLRGAGAPPHGYCGRVLPKWLGVVPRASVIPLRCATPHASDALRCCRQPRHNSRT